MASASELARATRVEEPPGPDEILTVRHESGAVVGADVRLVDRYEVDVRRLGIAPDVVGRTLDIAASAREPKKTFLTISPESPNSPKSK